MTTKEILTLQFGHYANFVGTHWWNLQESGFDYNSTEPSEINHNVLYREGLTTKGQVTFTPRLLLVDLKGSLGSLLKEGDLYEQGQATPEWEEGKVEIQDCPKVPKNEFQCDLDNPEALPEVPNKKYGLDQQVKVWSDYLYTRFHPRSVNIVNEYQHCNLETPFDSFNLGGSVWGSEPFQDEFSDKIRQYIEECDHFQGFHVLTDCTNGFAGLTAACLEHIADDFDRKSVLVFPTIPSFYPDNDFHTAEEQVYSIMNDSVRVVNLLLSFNSFTNFSSLFVPLCLGQDGWRQPGAPKQFYHTRYNAKLPYHSSGILAAALDTMTSMYRLKSDFSLTDLCADLGANGRKAACAGLCLPFSLNSDAYLIDCLDKWEGPLLKSITPQCSIETERAMQHLTLRGIQEGRLKSTKQKDLPAYHCETVKDMLEFYLSCTTYATASHVTALNKPLPTRNPFPDIFDEWIGVDGNVNAIARMEHTRVDSVPVLAGFQTGSGVGNMLKSLHAQARKLKIARFHQFALGRDEYEDSLNDILTLQENYEDSYLI